MFLELRVPCILHLFSVVPAKAPQSLPNLVKAKTSSHTKFVPQFSNAIYTVLFVQRDPEICHLINLEQMLAQEMCRNNKPELHTFYVLG
jgi:hypothetical protein